MSLERLLIIFIVTSSCTTTNRQPIDVSPCIINSDKIGGECSSRLDPKGWFLGIREMEGWACFSPSDTRSVLGR